MGKTRGKLKTKARKKEKLKSKKIFASYKQSFLNSLRKFDDPILKSKTELVVFTDKVAQEKISKIAADMCRTLLFTDNGVGIAAPQIGSLLSIIAVRPAADVKPIIMINPEIISNGDKRIKAVEGCLSYPGYYPLIERYLEVTVKYIDKNFKEQEKNCEGLEARIVQHELDHLLGNCSVLELYERAKLDPNAVTENDIEVNAFYLGQKLEKEEPITKGKVI